MISPPVNSAKLTEVSGISALKEAFIHEKDLYTEEQIAFALKLPETDTHVREVCRKMGISEATFYNWKMKFAGLGLTELRRLRQLEDEKQRLKKLVADLILDKEMLQEILKQKF
jgi:putative transposase